MHDNVLSSGDSGVGDTTTGCHSASGASDCESGSTEKCADRSHHFPMFERQSSFIHRERMIAHSTALESITINVDSGSSHPGGDDQDGVHHGGRKKLYHFFFMAYSCSLLNINPSDIHKYVCTQP